MSAVAEGASARPTEGETSIGGAQEVAMAPAAAHRAHEVAEERSPGPGDHYGLWRTISMPSASGPIVIPTPGLRGVVLSGQRTHRR
jgi:hypothetical protein